jgi:anti-sigma factor RsiW
VGFDGELDAARERTVQAHLARCTDCRRFAENLDRCAEALDLLAVPVPRAGFKEGLTARLPQMETRRRWLWGWFEELRPVAAAFGLLALCCGAIMGVSMNGEGTPNVPAQRDPAETLYADCFAAAPSQSAGAMFLALLQEGEN